MLTFLPPLRQLNLSWMMANYSFLGAKACFLRGQRQPFSCAAIQLQARASKPCVRAEVTSPLACTLLSRIKSRVHTCISRWPHGFLTTLNPSINYLLLPRPFLLFVPGPPAYSNPYRESSKRYGRSSEAYVVPGNH